MRYIFDVYDDDYYKISGSLNDEIIKELKEHLKIKDVKRGSILISREYDPIQVFQSFMKSNNIDIGYNFSDFNDFIGTEILEQLFKIAYTNKEFSSDQVDKLQSLISERVRQLSTNASFTFPEIQIQDDYFNLCLDEFSDKFSKSRVRIKFDWYFFYQLIEDQIGNRESLRFIAKNLFMINFAKNISKNYVSFLLSKFNISQKKEQLASYDTFYNRLKLLNELERYNKPSRPKSKDFINIENEREKLKKLLKAVGLRSPSMERKKSSSGKIIYKVKNGKVKAVLEESSSSESSSSTD